MKEKQLEDELMKKRDAERKEKEEQQRMLEAELAKGQLISEYLFDFFKFSKKPTKNLTNFCPRI